MRHFFIKNITVANRIILVLAITTLALTFVLLRIKGLFDKHINKFREEVKTQTGKDYIDAYRDSWTGRIKTHIIWYDSADVQKYMDVTFRQWANIMPDTAGFKWGVGFYTIRRRDGNGKSRLDFLVVPTLRNKDGVILDHRDPKYQRFYDRKTLRSIPIDGLCDDCTGYDAGHLWP